jgi:hypothetical protein
VFPNGERLTVTSDENGDFTARSTTTQNVSGNVKVIAEDRAGNSNVPTKVTSIVDTKAPSVTINEDGIKSVNLTEGEIKDSNGTTVGGTTHTAGLIEVKGHTEPNTNVTVVFPNGERVTVTSDENGDFTARSTTTQNDSGDVKVVAEDRAGNSSSETTRPFTAWYKTKEDDNGTVVTYGKDNTLDEHKSIINISKDLEVERVESEDNVVKLNITGPSSEAPAAIVEAAENGCDTDSYKAFVTLYEEDGSVETGFVYADSACGDVADSTVYDGKRLKFVPGTESEMKKTADKGGMVIITDAKLEKATKFGER